MKPSTKPLFDKRSLPFRMKVLCFRDILRCPEARRHLWSLYYTGEAYEDLHPQGVYVEKLPPWLGRILKHHLADETRHAGVFRQLLEREGAVPQALRDEEDLGWHCLTQVVPDVVAKAESAEHFSRREIMRYMAFLHALEMRSTYDLAALREAAKELGEDDLVLAIDGIIKDEQFHATYTHRALFKIAQKEDDPAQILLEILRGEKRAYTQSMRCILSEFLRLGARPKRWYDMLRWKIMDGFVKLGLAFPRLPAYERIPRALTG